MKNGFFESFSKSLAIEVFKLLPDYDPNNSRKSIDFKIIPKKSHQNPKLPTATKRVAFYWNGYVKGMAFDLDILNLIELDPQLHITEISQGVAQSFIDAVDRQNRKEKEKIQNDSIQTESAQ